MKVCIDPGHGGSDPGAVGKTPFTLNEKDVALPVSLMLKDELEAKGHVVILTRDIDKAVSLNSRSALANQENVDVFIGIHCNSFSNSGAEGIETWIFPGSQAGQNLARKIQGSLVAKFPKHKDRGVKEANFHVLRETSMPAVLVECEFISNPSQLQFLADQTNQEMLASAIAEGI